MSKYINTNLVIELLKNTAIFLINHPLNQFFHEYNVYKNYKIKI